MQAYVYAGMDIQPEAETEKALKTIGYYRLRGYCCHLYDNTTKRYHPNTKFKDIITYYHFDCELRRLIFGFLSTIEVTLRAHLSQALLSCNDALILNDPVIFEDKVLYWRNLSTISSEIARANDKFVEHHFANHDGMIPVWVAVETMSFGTLSKVISNLKTGHNSVYRYLASNYQFKVSNGNLKAPQYNQLTNWIKVCAVVRNICAHNGRLYNRAITKHPVLLNVDRLTPNIQTTKLYQVILVMKYLRSTDDDWNVFYSDFQNLIQKYPSINLTCMNFPPDWKAHFTL